MGSFGRRDPDLDGWLRVAERANRGGLCDQKLVALVQDARWAASEYGRRGGEMHEEDVALVEYVAEEARRLAA